jgi:hypothetical protein
MAFPLAIPLAISAIQALVRYRGRVDTILSLNAATDSLPFALPPAPEDIQPCIQPMLTFFRTPAGGALLALQGMGEKFNLVAANPTAPQAQDARDALLDLYFKATDSRPAALGPQPPAFAHVGPSAEMRLAYFVVESDRLSRNPAVTRLLLATADTLLEVAGANASLFISNPRTAALVGTLLDEFAGQRDWDDASGLQIFKTLLGAAAAAAIEHRGDLPPQPALQALLGALADVRKDMDATGNATAGTDFVAGFISFDGFQRLVSKFLTHAADTPELLPANPALRASVAAMLKAAASHPLAGLKDPKVLADILQAGLEEATASLADLAGTSLAGQPLLAVVLKSVADAIHDAAAQRVLFGQIASGQVLSTLYQASLAAIGRSPALLADAAGLNTFVAQWISALADQLSRQTLANAVSVDTLQALAVRSIQVLAQNPQILAGKNVFAAKVIGGTLEAAASALRDGMSPDDFAAIAEAALKTATDNLNLVRMDDRLRAILVALGATFSAASLSSLTNAKDRKALFFAALDAVAANPQVWSGFAARDLVQPLVLAVINGLATDPTQLLSGPALVPAFRSLLLAAARRGQAIAGGNVAPAVVQTLLERALARANAAIGQSIDGENLPAFLERVVSRFLLAPADVTDPAALDTWLTGILNEFVSVAAASPA